MKLLKHIIRAGALCGLLLTTAAAKAQTVQLKVLDWNVLSFEMTDKSNQIDFIVDEYVDLIKAQNPDIVCINELETGTSRMGKEKLTELASRLDMYPYFIMSYPKDVGFYGNGILSKYPIVSSFSALHPYKHAKGEGNYQWNTGYEYYLYGYDQRSMGYIDILVYKLIQKFLHYNLSMFCQFLSLSRIHHVFQQKQLFIEMVNACRVFIFLILIFVHYYFRFYFRIINLSSPTTTICKCSGNSNSSYGIQPVCILHTFSFYGIRYD